MIPENIIGKSISRVESAEKATGTAVFTADMKLPNMLFGKVLRSPYPHAKIVSIDTSKAEALPGVKAVVTYKKFTQCYL
jgi:xanthine dehydrogenase molybdenum-binding subunit